MVLAGQTFPEMFGMPPVGIGTYNERPNSKKGRPVQRGDILGFGRCQTLALLWCCKAWACNA